MTDDGPLPSAATQEPFMAQSKAKQSTFYPDEIRSRTFATVLEMAVENPLLTPAQIAALLQRDQRYIRSLMMSDAFIEMRAKAILERYGDKINGIRGRVLDTVDMALSAIQRRIANPESDCSAQTLLDATELLMKYAIPQVDSGAGGKGPEQQNTLNISLSMEDISNARSKQNLHALSTQPPNTAHFIEHQPEASRPTFATPDGPQSPELSSVLAAARGESETPLD